MKIKGFVFLIIVGFFGLRTYASAQDMSGLSYDDQTSLEVACVVAKTQGPASYHSCLNRQLTQLGSSRAPDTSRLSYDDQTSLEVACVVAKTQGPAAYHSCLNQQVAQLGSNRAPDTSRLSYDDQISLEIACVVAKTQGPASYHSCLNQQIAQLGPVANTLTTTVADTVKTQSKAEEFCAYQKPLGDASYLACVKYQLSQTRTPSVITIPVPTVSSALVPTRTVPANTTGLCAENGSCFGDISPLTGLPKTEAVRGYYRTDGTYVRGYYRSHK